MTLGQNEAKVRVKLDTGQAKSELSSLTRLGAATAGRLGEGLRRAVGAGARAIGLGVGIGAATAAIRGPTQGGITDVVGEAFGAMGKDLEAFFLGDMGVEARASRQAREQTIAAFGTAAGVQNQVPPGARAFYEQVRALRTQEERGRFIFEQDTSFRSTNPSDLFDRIMTALGQLGRELMDYLADKLNPF